MVLEFGVSIGFEAGGKVTYRRSGGATSAAKACRVENELHGQENGRSLGSVRYRFGLVVGNELFELNRRKDARSLDANRVKGRRIET